MPLRTILLYVFVARALDIGTAYALYFTFPSWFVKYEQNSTFIDLVTQANYLPFVAGQALWIGMGLGILVAVRYATKVTQENEQDRKFHNSRAFLLGWSCALFMFGFLVVYSVYGALTNVLGFVYASSGMP